MKKTLLYPISLAAVFALGYLSGHMQDAVAHAQSAPAEKAVYLIAASKPVQAAPEKMKAYRETAGPLAKQAGMQLLGSGELGKTLQVLEGKWPYEGRVGVEKFRSMKALLDFWNSAEYQKAKKLRDEANFIIAVEATQ